MQPLKKTQISKLVFGGYGLGQTHEGKITMILNALPGEEVNYFITKPKKNYFQGIAEEVVKPSPYRIEPREPGQFLSTSPWQILAWDRELYWKQVIAQEAYFKVNDIPVEIPIVADENMQYGYRNKMEFSFILDEEEQLNLAFFKRGSKRKIPVQGSLLAEPIINEIADQIITWLKTQNIEETALKTLIVRSNGEGKGIAALFIKDEPDFTSYPELDENFLGFQIYFSKPKSPASIPTKLLYQAGQDFLITKLKNTQLKFGLLSFFQVNIPLFEEALDDIAQYLDPNKSIVDYYAGVGAISLPLAQHYQAADLVDNNEEAINYAKDNIQINNISNCRAKCLPAEKITELITPDKIIILDPPRAGLHQKMIDRILEQKPPRLIYLSCNMTTHARDLELLQNDYKLKFIKLYNFFPRTPHVECLAVMDLKQ